MKILLKILCGLAVLILLLVLVAFAYMSVRRNKQFVGVHPSTNTRLDHGLQLNGVKPANRLEAADSWNGLVIHQVRLETPAQFDREVHQCLKAAYSAA